MAIGFVLITTMPGKEESVRNALDSIEHVTDRWMLFGEFDILARVQAHDEFTLTRCIVEQIRPLSGIQDTKTMIGAEL
ncbi:MAG: AsnC family transcriptional regulator [Euryarchaeota archaeon]|nr:AsnC family transcriptional regulator [Euryarchaeota archaeon]|tara:strand:- start:662 stop:895 length:234 start_codon:yes stop_codon:yes gene_type:complete